MAAPTESVAVSANVNSLMLAANYAAIRTLLGLVISTNVQAYHANLTSWAGIAPGANVGTALAVAVGTDGAFVVKGGALGTPTSGVATNLTGTAAGLTAGAASAVAVGGITGLGTGVATALAINTGSAGSVITDGGTVAALNATTATATTLNIAENGGIVLDAALSADGKYCGIVEAGTAGATLAFGDLVYLAAADSRWELADADAEATAGPVKLGMCVLAAASDGSATTILLVGKIRADAAFPTMTISAPVYVGTTAGDIQVAKPSGTDDVVRVVGHANTADELYFNPSGFYITAV